MQFESGCKINVTKEQDGDQTVVILNGNAEAIEKAKNMIDELVDRNSTEFKIVEAPAQVTELEIIDWKKVSEEAVSMNVMNVFNGSLAK